MFRAVLLFVLLLLCAPSCSCKKEEAPQPFVCTLVPPKACAMLGEPVALSLTLEPGACQRYALHSWRVQAPHKGQLAAPLGTALCSGTHLLEYTPQTAGKHQLVLVLDAEGTQQTATCTLEVKYKAGTWCAYLEGDGQLRPTVALGHRLPCTIVMSDLPPLPLTYRLERWELHYFTRPLYDQNDHYQNVGVRLYTTPDGQELLAPGQVLSTTKEVFYCLPTVQKTGAYRLVLTLARGQQEEKTICTWFGVVEKRSDTASERSDAASEAYEGEASEEEG